MLAATRLVLAVLAGVLALFATTPAAGYCRKTTSSGDSELADPSLTGACDVGAAGALPLYWGKPCVEYRVVVDPALEASGRMTSARANDVVHRAAAAWNQAACPGRAGGAAPVAIQTVDVASARCPGERWGTHNEVRFTTEPSDGDTLAVTDVIFDPASGAVLTAITRVFDVYADLGATPEASDPHVEYIVRHELGHFLGLAHSQRADAVMNASFRARPSDGLTADDLGGLCEAYSADAPVGAGCGVSGAQGGAASGTGRTGNGGPWPAGLAVAASLLVLGARRRRRALGVLCASLVLLATMLAGTARAAPTSTPPPKAQAAARVVAPKRRLPAKRPAPITPASPEPTDAELTAFTPDTIPELAPPPRALGASPTPASPTSASRTLPMKAVAPGPPEPEPDRATGAPRSTDLYLGGSYRAFVLPRMMLGVVGRANKDPFFQSASVEAAFHATRGVSIVPALTFADLSTGDLLVGARGSELASSFAYVRSDLSALAASVQLVWALPISRRVELELGLELGVGVTFGRLVDTWVHETADGPLAYGGRRFAPCRTVKDGVGCRPQDHGSPTPVKVNDYREPSVFAGGAAPTLLPWVSLPLVGVRTRIGDDVALRIGVGASATGLWAGVSLGYLVARRSP